MASHHIGIANISVYVPEQKMSQSELALISRISEEVILEKTGVSTKAILPHNKDPIYMAEYAVRQLLEKNNINSLELDCIIYCSVGVANQYLWSPAAKIQQLIGAHNAFSFEIVNGCNAGNLGLQMAVNILQTDRTKNKVLVVTCDALSRMVNHADPNHLCIYNFSDGATAILVTHCTINKVLSFYAKTEAQFVDHLNIPAQSHYVVMSDNEEEDMSLSAAYKKMYPLVIRTAVQKANLSLRDIDHLFINQGDHRLFDFLSQELLIPENKIYKSYSQYGHMGGSDIFFGFHEKQKNGEVSSGDIIVLASSAVGFSWGASVIQA